jgi:hypothetical protein
MFAIIQLLATFITDLFKSPRRLEVENLFLRHQLNIALRGGPLRPRLRGRVAHHEKRKQTLECQRRTHAEIDLSDSFDYGYQRGRAGILWRSTPAEFKLPLPSRPRVALQ